MRRTAVVAAMVAFALLALWLCARPMASPPPHDAPTAAADADRDTARATVASHPDADAPSRVAVDDTPQDLLAAPFPFALDVVLGHGGWTADVFLAPDGVPLNRVPLTPGAGITRVAFDGKQPTQTIVLDDGLLRRIALHSGTVARTTLGDLLPRHVNQGATRALSGPYPTASPRFLAGTDPALPMRFTAGIEVGDVAMLDTLSFDTRIPEDATGPLPGSTILGIVTNAHGAPVEGAMVWLEPFHLFRRTRADGAFSFQPMSKENAVLTATHASFGRAALTIAEDTLSVRLRLGFAGCVRGHVLAPDGTPLANRRVLWRADDGDFRNDVHTDATGAFLLSDLPTVAGTLWACDHGSDAVLPGASLRVSGVPEFDHVLTLDPARCRSGVAIDPLVANAGPRDQIAVRLWQVESGLGVHLALYDDGTFAACDVPAGSYRCELLVPGCDAVMTEVFWLDGTNPVNLGRCDVPAPARLVIDAQDSGSPLRVLRLRPDNDVWIAPPADRDVPDRLPGGDYALAWRDRDGGTRWQRFTAKSGETVTVRLTR